MRYLTEKMRKRDMAANAVLALGLAGNLQSPQHIVRSGHIEAPGVQLMQRMMKKRREADRNLDSDVVSQGARNRSNPSTRERMASAYDRMRKQKREKADEIIRDLRKEQKTFKNFMNEAVHATAKQMHYPHKESHLVEMRKEDKVKGENKTPLYVSKTSGRVERKLEDNQWKLKKSTRKSLSPRAATGRMKQGMIDKETQPYATRMPGAARHAQGGGGSGAAAPGRLRGVGKLKQQEIDRAQRGRGERPLGSGPSPEQKVALRRSQRARSVGGGNR